ncbi:MAG: SDR family NAD(P)-dependent oxidoreductase [Polyangiaceae bacterium]
MRAGERSGLGRYGSVAIVAGAAEGLGAAFSRELARAGLDLVLVDVREDLLGALARELEAAFAVRVRAVVVDLAAPDAGERIERAAADWPIGLVVFNAAAAPIGPFERLAFADAARVVDVNNRAALDLLSRFVPAMVARGRGALVLVGSNAGLLGHPLTAVYGASKAFLVRLGEALHVELAPRGIDVLVPCPGAIATPNLARSGARLSRFLTADPNEVAREALAELGRGRAVVSLGAANRLTMTVLSALPRQIATRLLGRVMRATYPRAQ